MRLKDELTDEELEILQLMASDLTGNDICCELGISHGRFLRDCNSIYLKLDVKTRYGAISKAFKEGLI